MKTLVSYFSQVAFSQSIYMYIYICVFTCNSRKQRMRCYWVRFSSAKFKYLISDVTVIWVNSFQWSKSVASCQVSRLLLLYLSLGNEPGELWSLNDFIVWEQEVCACWKFVKMVLAHPHVGRVSCLPSLVLDKPNFFPHKHHWSDLLLLCGFSLLSLSGHKRKGQLVVCHLLKHFLSWNRGVIIDFCTETC